MTLKLKHIDHVAIICSDYERSKYFYTKILGLKIISEHFRSERASYKLDLAIGDCSQIELFSFSNPPKRVTTPEACGLRHLAFKVDNLEEQIILLKEHDILLEPVRIDEYTGKKFVFFFDPDGLPLELYER